MAIVQDIQTAVLARLAVSAESVSAGLLWAGLGAAVLFASAILIVGLHQPLIDLNSFRQTQTAISVYWLARVGHWLAYETPVLGAPWSLPFEFPLYQWIVVGLVKLGFPIDPTGRVVTFVFYMATLWPMHILFRAAKLGRMAFLSSAILFLLAPIYLNWNRGFMIESCALFLSALSAAMMARFLEERGRLTGTLAIGAGCAAVLTKLTTFPSFAMISGCFLLADLSKRLRAPLVAQLRAALAPTMALLLPFVAGVPWVAFCDEVKVRNEFAQHLTSGALKVWNFGTLDQRLSSDLWNATIYNRALPDVFGYGVLLAAFVAGACLLHRRSLLALTVTAGCFFIPFLCFTNLHIVHPYYQQSNAIFAAAAAGIGIGAISRTDRHVAAIGLLAVLVAAQLAYWRHVYKPILVADFAQDATGMLRAADYVRHNTAPETAEIVFGMDWDSTIPYYSERKGITMPVWARTDLLERVLHDPEAFLGGEKLGAVVRCSGRSFDQYADRVAAIDRFIDQYPKHAEFGACQVFMP